MVFYIFVDHETIMDMYSIIIKSIISCLSEWAPPLPTKGLSMSSRQLYPIVFVLLTYWQTNACDRLIFLLPFSLLGEVLLHYNLQYCNKMQVWDVEIDYVINN